VEKESLERAERECLDDAEARECQREREALRRFEQDREYAERFAARIMELFPGCPEKESREIAEWTCRRNSGRIGRTALAKTLDAETVRIAVIAHVRHTRTRYEAYLMQGLDRQ
jgi:hypothetical protein